MRMYMSDGTYWQTLLVPSPAPVAIAIGPWILVQDNGSLVVGLPVPDGVVPYSGLVSYEGEAALAGKSRKQIWEEGL
jgi:hypothetical protein